MPYDPRPESQGGNRGIDERFSRSAPAGQFRVIGVDTFDGGDWVQGDFADKADALKCARDNGGEMTRMYVYDDKGNAIGSAGKF